MKALIINCTLKQSPKESNTQALIDLVVEEYKKLGVGSETLRLVDYNIKPGVSSDEGAGDQWPEILEKIRSCDVFIIASPIWVGHTPSTAQQVIERLDAIFHEKELADPENGQYFTYGKVAGALVTGNEDGAHSVIAQILWAMHEFGFTIPPNANAYWVGKAGPGPSYIEADGRNYEYTNKTLRYMVHNTTFFAKLLKENPITTNLKSLNLEAKNKQDPG